MGAMTSASGQGEFLKKRSVSLLNLPSTMLSCSMFKKYYMHTYKLPYQFNTIIFKQWFMNQSDHCCILSIFTLALMKVTIYIAYM